MPDRHALLTIEEASILLERTGSENQALLETAIDGASEFMEWRAGQHLRERVCRRAVTAVCTLATGAAAFTGAGLSAMVAGDDVVGVGVPRGTRLLSITDDGHATLDQKATASGAQTLMFGWRPLVTHGDGTHELLLAARPVTSVQGIYAVDYSGTRTALHTDGYRIVPGSGVILLARRSPAGRFNIEVDCVSGYRPPSGTDVGHPEWYQLQRLCGRLVVIFFKDVKQQLGRHTDITGMQVSASLRDWALPSDLLRDLDSMRVSL